MSVQTLSNREVIESLYETFVTGRHESIVAGGSEPIPAAFDEQTLWIEPRGNARSGSFRGVDEIIEQTANCLTITDGTWGTEVLEILGGHDYVVVIERALALRNGMSLNMLCTTVYEMTDGVIAEMRVLPFDPVAWNAFWS